MIKDIQELNYEVAISTRDENWDDNYIAYLAKLLKVYIQAEEAALSEGWIGVGRITYAEKVMQKFQEENPYKT